METTIEKIDDNTIQITEQLPAPEPIVTLYTLDELTKNKENLEGEIADIQSQLDSVNSLIGNFNV
jgi:hypothetical protein